MNVKKTIFAVMLASSMTVGLMGCSTINDFVNNIEKKNEKTDKIDENDKDTNKGTAKEEKKNADDNKPVADSTKVSNKTLNIGMFVPNGNYEVKCEGSDVISNDNFIKGDGTSYQVVGTTGKGPVINVYSIKNGGLNKVFTGDLTDKEMKDIGKINYLSKNDKSQELLILNEPLKVGTKWDNKEIVEVGENLKLDKETLKGAYIKTWEQVKSNGKKTVKVYYYSEGLGCVKYDVLLDGVSVEKSTVTSVTKK
ncbi:hypothetical protein [Clostridium gasigenes]|uniref:Lipoprotein n=1 Tax=Clostridium gasigenes TaxID=94869 RepID=A0A1H0R431_9CLOT|nr:hypothetical protein [Clostridium gasigenes]SDP24283.1 hypothetical protein SAMN04488529_10319 [Clostridium gasigenes]